MHRFSFWIAGIAAAFLILIIIWADRGMLPEVIVNLYAFPNGDKVGHFLLMGGVSFCANLACAARRIHLRFWNPLLGSLLVTLAVTLEEFSQQFFTTRTFDLLDLAASLAGIWLLGQVAAWLIAHSRHAGSTKP